MKDVLISVIVPVYKAEKSLDRCVESIAGQTHRNLEIILVDDGSPDSSPELCDKWALGDSRIKVVHKKNAGASSARNAGLSAATGEYITFVDSDDWIEPDMYSSLLKDILAFNADKAMCGFYTSNRPVEQNEDVRVLDGMQSRALSVLGGNDEVWRALYSASLISDMRFDESFTVAEDTLFNYEINRKINRQTVNSRKLYCYNQDTEGALHIMDSKKTLDRITVTEYMWENETTSPELCGVMYKAYARKILSIVEDCVRTDSCGCNWYKDKVRRNVRARLPKLLCSSAPAEDKLKLLLFNFCHPLYSVLLRRVIKKNAK